MFPNCEGPVPHSSFEKSSVIEVRVERVFAFSLALVFPAVEFALRLRLLLTDRFVFELPLLLLLLSLVMLAIAKIKITTPMPMKTSTAPIPSSHGQTLRFCGVDGGIGDHAGGGGGGGGTAGIWLG